MGTEVSVSGTEGSDRRGGIELYSGILWSDGLSDIGVERSAGSRASVGTSTAEDIDIEADGGSKRQDGLEDVFQVSVFKEEAVLGQSFLGEGILCGYGRAERGDDTEVCKVSGEAGTEAIEFEVSGIINNGTTPGPAFSEGWLCVPPYRGLKASPRSKNADV